MKKIAISCLFFFLINTFENRLHVFAQTEAPISTNLPPEIKELNNQFTGIITRHARALETLDDLLKLSTNVQKLNEDLETLKQRYHEDPLKEIVANLEKTAAQIDRMIRNDMLDNLNHLETSLLQALNSGAYGDLRSMESSEQKLSAQWPSLSPTVRDASLEAKKQNIDRLLTLARTLRSSGIALNRLDPNTRRLILSGNQDMIHRLSKIKRNPEQSLELFDGNPTDHNDRLLEVPISAKLPSDSQNPTQAPARFSNPFQKGLTIHEVPAFPALKPTESLLPYEALKTEQLWMNGVHRAFASAVMPFLPAPKPPMPEIRIGDRGAHLSPLGKGRFKAIPDDKTGSTIIFQLDTQQRLITERIESPDGDSLIAAGVPGLWAWAKKGTKVGQTHRPGMTIYNLPDAWNVDASVLAAEKNVAKRELLINQIALAYERQRLPNFQPDDPIIIYEADSIASFLKDRFRHSALDPKRTEITLLPNGRLILNETRPDGSVNRIVGYFENTATGWGNGLQNKLFSDEGFSIYAAHTAKSASLDQAQFTKVYQYLGSWGREEFSERTDSNTDDWWWFFTGAHAETVSTVRRTYSKPDGTWYNRGQSVVKNVQVLYDGPGGFGAWFQEADAAGKGIAELAGAGVAAGLYLASIQDKGWNASAQQQDLIERMKANTLGNSIARSVAGESYDQWLGRHNVDMTRNLQNVGSEMTGLGYAKSGAVLQGGIEFANGMPYLMGFGRGMKLVRAIPLIGGAAEAGVSAYMNTQMTLGLADASINFADVVRNGRLNTPEGWIRLTALTRETLNFPLTVGIFLPALMPHAEASGAHEPAGETSAQSVALENDMALDGMPHLHGMDKGAAIEEIGASGDQSRLNRGTNFERHRNAIQPPLADPTRAIKNDRIAALNAELIESWYEQKRAKYRLNPEDLNEIKQLNRLMLDADLPNGVTHPPTSVYFESTSRGMVDQGIKLRVGDPGTPEGRRQVLQKFLSIIKDQKLDRPVDFKIAKTMKALPGDDANKFITIYAETPAEAQELAIILDAAFKGKGLNAKRPVNDLPFGKSGLISWRYGSWRASNLMNVPDAPEPIVENRTDPVANLLHFTNVPEMQFWIDQAREQAPDRMPPAPNQAAKASLVDPKMLQEWVEGMDGIAFATNFAQQLSDAGATPAEIKNAIHYRDKRWALLTHPEHGLPLHHIGIRQGGKIVTEKQADDIRNQWGIQNEAPPASQTRESPLQQLAHIPRQLYDKFISRRQAPLPASIQEFAASGKIDVIPPSKAPRVPEGWTIYSHGTNWSQRNWHIDGAHNPFDRTDAVMAVTDDGVPPGLSVVAIDGGSRGPHSSKDYAHKIGNRFSDAAPIELRILAPKPGAADGLPLEVQKELDRYHSTNAVMQHPTIPPGTKLVRIARAVEGKTNVFYYVPDYLLPYAADFLGLKTVLVPTPEQQKKSLAKMRENQSITQLEAMILRKAHDLGIALTETRNDIRGLRETPDKRTHILAKYGLNANDYFPASQELQKHLSYLDPDSQEVLARIEKTRASGKLEERKDKDVVEEMRLHLQEGDVYSGDFYRVVDETELALWRKEPGRLPNGLYAFAGPRENVAKSYGKSEEELKGETKLSLLKITGKAVDYHAAGIDEGEMLVYKVEKVEVFPYEFKSKSPKRTLVEPPAESPEELFSQAQKTHNVDNQDHSIIPESVLAQAGAKLGMPASEIAAAVTHLERDLGMSLKSFTSTDEALLEYLTTDGEFRRDYLEPRKSFKYRAPVINDLSVRLQRLANQHNVSPDEINAIIKREHLEGLAASPVTSDQLISKLSSILESRGIKRPSPKLPRVTPVQMIRALERHGFAIARQNGSHVQMKKENLFVTVPFHRGDIPIGTLKSILRQSQMPADTIVGLN